MSYSRFGLMIATSTVVMFGLMYLNTYALEHVFFSETRAYMALLMGAAMAVVMLGFMRKMYASRALNLTILAGALAVFAGALWLVRSQATVSGESYMRAMIPHHSIAIMTSERAGLRDARVRKLAGEIALAQRREIAEMRYLVAAVAEGRREDDIYGDPAPGTGTVADALANTLVAGLDPAPMPAEEADRVLAAGRERCAFRFTRAGDPILWTTEGEAEPDAAAAIKLNGVIVELAPGGMAGLWEAEGVAVEVRLLDEDGAGAGWRGDAELEFMLARGLRTGYRGFWSCGG